VASAIEIDLLGGLLLRIDGRETPVRGAHPRALLARLSMSAGEIVPLDDLIEDIWSNPPDQVLSTLRAHVSRLRTTTLGGLLVGDRRGYVLDIAPHTVDLVAARERRTMLAAMPAERRLPGLLEIDGVLGREALPGLERHPFVPRLRSALEDERRTLQEDIGELALESGDVGLATAVLAATCVRHPRHERPARLLALALARAGRTSDAIDAIDAFRERLGERSGLRASARMQSLRAAVVRLDPEVVAPASAPSGPVRRVGIAIPLTRFVGREDDLAELQRAALLHRLVTLVGPAGVGKTRLAVEAARRSSTDDEQYMVDLADVEDPNDVVAVIATAVRARTLDLDAVARRLRAGRTLLVIDNADRVLGALSVAVDALLAAAPGVRIVVTSREPLRAAAEHVRVVHPLATGHGGDAWRLFLDRAVDARGGTPFDELEQASAEALCASLEGLPLAIELATARLDVLGVNDVRAGVGAFGGAVGRHTSVRAAIAWSVDLLDDDDRHALIALSRFAGAFTPEAVAGVAGVSAREADALLQRLVDKSLVALDRGPTGRRRFRVLEAMREYLAPLDTDADAALWRQQHRRWFSAFAADLSPSLRSFAVTDALVVLDGFRPDLAAALTGSIAAGDRGDAVRLAGALAHYWYLRGLLVEGRRRLEAALEVPGPVDDAREAGAHLELANLAYQTGDAPAAFAAIARALEHAAAAGDASVQVVALARAGYGRSLFGDREAGSVLLAQAHAALELAEPWARSEFHMANGQLLRSQGRLDAALAAVTEAHRIASSIGYTWMVTSARYVMTKTLLDARRPRDAIAVARSAIATARASEDAAGALALLHAVAGACAFVERHEEGARLLGAVDEIGLRYDYSTMIAEGADAVRLRDAIAAGLPPAEFERAYRSGRALGWDEVIPLIDRLPRVRAESALLGA
jgi:predicted ATPase/DNA-binding SARP family transcriptional activator